MKVECQECHVVDVEKHGHAVYCSQCPIERKAQLYKAYYEMLQQNCARNAVAFDRLREKVTYWQGKFRIVKEENNALRKKVNGRKSVEASVIERYKSKGKLEAIKLHRAITGNGLKESKEEVERLATIAGF